MERKVLIEELIEAGIKDKKVLDTIYHTPRHLFVPKHLKKEAYLNIPLPIGEQQTISQPYTVAVMLEALELKEGDKVLEIGAGSGWNAALISKLVGKNGKIYTIEIIPKLAEFAKKNLKDYKNVNVICGDGSKGYKKASPYDAIIITAGAPETPKVLINQLKDGGSLVAPIGPHHNQEMFKITKKGKELKIKRLGYFVFVPLRGKYGY